MISDFNKLDKNGIQEIKNVLDDYDNGELSFVVVKLKLAKIWNKYRVSPDHLCGSCSEGNKIYQKSRDFINDL